MAGCINGLLLKKEKTPPSCSLLRWGEPYGAGVQGQLSAIRSRGSATADCHLYVDFLFLCFYFWNSTVLLGTWVNAFIRPCWETDTRYQLLAFCWSAPWLRRSRSRSRARVLVYWPGPGAGSGWSGDCPKAVGKTPALSLWGGGAPEAPRRLRRLSLSRPGQRIVFQLSEAFGLCCGCAWCFHAETTPSTFSPCCFAQHFGSMYSGFYWYFWFSVVGFEQWLPTF